MVAHPVEQEPFTGLAEVLFLKAVVAADNEEGKACFSGLLGSKGYWQRSSKLVFGCGSVPHRAKPANVMADLGSDAATGFSNANTSLGQIDLCINTCASRELIDGKPFARPIDVKL